MWQIVLQSCFLYFIVSISVTNGLMEGGRNVVKTEWYVQEKYQGDCGFMAWSKCTRYMTVYKTSLSCAPGWSTFFGFSFALNCDYAICNGKTDNFLWQACSIYYPSSYQTTRLNGTVKWSGGHCNSPDSCTDCNDGFYSVGPRCEICGAIDNCYHSRCQSGSDQICVNCHGVVMEQPYWRAYTNHLDITKCQKTCSWRGESTRCFPGKCTNELASECVCEKNFDGYHCETILEYPEMSFNSCNFSDKDGKYVVENDGNYIKNDHPVIWSNFGQYKIIHVKITAKYKQPAMTRNDQHYVVDFKVGIIDETATLSYYKAGNTLYSKESKTCIQSGMSKDKPDVDGETCIFVFYWKTDIKHDEKIMFELSSTNGGYVDIVDRENSIPGTQIRYYYNGKTTTRHYEFHWDLIKPSHCSVSLGTSCTSFVTIPDDITTKPSLTISWGGWTDDLSQLSNYSIEIFDLKFDGSSSLLDAAGPKVIEKLKIPAVDFSATITLPEPGVYSIHLTAFDKAGNWQTGRGILFYDNNSVVYKLGQTTKCETASKNTSSGWVVQDTSIVKIVWPNRFINTRHKNNGWLCKVKMPEKGDMIYEDLYGDRTNISIKNINAIVDFQVAYEIHSDESTLKDSRPLASVTEIKNEYEILILNWADGDRLSATVKAIDVIGASNQDTITVYRDTSPPIIQNLWLTKGDRLNVNVHSVEDFTKMIIEWESFDLHSGLESVSWKLYDNFGDNMIVHGYEDITSQGNATTWSECINKYSTYARGANCYCTAFKGCFHRHFQVKPEIKQYGGLILNKDKGVHEYDYFIEVSVTSIAKLTTVLTKKITIDITPPHAGVVHDGISGNPEIDYQQGRNLHAHWDQFFDRESGVYFYQYIVGTSCADKHSFNLDLATHPYVRETYNTYGSHTASSDGTFYFTVVAYNRALEPSIPVCSDGVTIDSSVPGVKEVIVKDSMITGGLVTDSTRTNYYILGSNRVRRLIPNPTSDCVSKATVLSNVHLYPLKTFDNGTVDEVNGVVFCSNSSSAPSVIGLTLFKSSLMELFWKPIDIPAKVYDYEVGFCSTPGSAAPDIMAFESTKQHSHHRVKHGNVPDGTRFYIIIKTISKSNVEGLTSLGPCFLDTTPPDFSGDITVSLSGGFLITTWLQGAFSDSEELFQLDYKFAIGHTAYGTEVQQYKSLQFGGPCNRSYPPICTVVKLTDLEWYLHGHHTYYVSIKVTNTAGLVKIQTSSPYIHDVQLPAEGVVLDIDTLHFQSDQADIPSVDIEDIDFQTDTNSMTARWSGFAHPHLDVTYKISIGRTKGGSDVISMKDVGTGLSYKATGLSLIPYQKYYMTVIAVSLAGNTQVSSDGVTIVTENDVLTGVMIYDGEPCNMTAFLVGHHQDDNRLYCTYDSDVQMSTNSLRAYWTVPNSIKPYTTDAYIGIEKRSGIGNVWSKFLDYFHVSTVFDVSIDDLTLNPGIMYRVILKLCAKMICFRSIATNGVMIMPNPPVTGGITVEHLNTTMTGEAEKLMISFTRFYDPDIEDTNEKYDAVDKYEFAITDDSLQGKTYTAWTNINTITLSGYKISFQYQLTGTMDFSRCKRLSVRGYNKAKQYSIVSTEIKNCKAVNPILVKPNIVIDAVGEPDLLDGIGKPIFLEKNALWKNPDADYTPYKNVISAVWPTLRHRKYKYAILDARSIDVTTYYRQVNQLVLTDPCAHPDKIRCGTTQNEFINEQFEVGSELVHGTRYTVCVHADATTIQHETWTEVLNAISTCSDGVVVDLTSPVAGRVWIGVNPGRNYQKTLDYMYVNWDGFRDVEEYNTSPHSTGIKEYILGIGTTPRGNDVYAFENVGVVQHKALHELNLQNGYQYYATLTAIDFANRVTIAISDRVTIDVTPPEKSNKPITLTDRHITSRTEVIPCWKDVFTDIESGIDYYMWSIGSEPGYTDMMPYVKVVGEECGETDENNPLDLKDGHYYYINVRAFNKAGLSSLATSWAFRVETSPPTAGHVYDGDKTQITGSVKDTDFQTETKVLHAYWEGFHDSHSTIKEYYVSVGTCPECEDILPEQAVGITDEFTMENIHLGSGLRYYITVTACNTADMCTTVTSDGVIIDNSAPVVGSVQDGVGYMDEQYQSMTHYISAKWYGFDDPQSGLDKYVWRVGTKVGGDDIVPPTPLHLTETAVLLNSTRFQLDLPVNKTIYITVRAYNKAGLWSEDTSNGFLVDTTPPVITTHPIFSEDFGVHGMTQIYRTSMKIYWAIDDAESFIKRQYLSIKSHIGGEFMLSSQSVNGIARSYVFTGLELHDGVTYYVTLISCNSAEICSTSTSPGMFVDSTPPSRGMFAITTDHAADPDLARSSAGWMTWTSNAVYLAWLGFSDLHSQIDYYKVAVGTSYMAQDLTKDQTAKYIHVNANTDHGDEGKVQLYKVETESIRNYDILYITIWAVNKVGLRSNLIHSAFRRNPGGSLDLIRRCSSLTCEGHCVCAPQDQKCSTTGTCKDVSSTVFTSTKYTLLLVKDTNGYFTDDQSVTATDTVLRATWQVSQVYPSKPKLYEWSVGFSDRTMPQGIYDLVEDKMWQDAGQLTNAIFTVNTGKTPLINGMEYSVFVRVWYDSNTYAVFKSNGILVMTKAPALSVVRGSAVAEKVQGTTVKDEDYIRIGRPITFTWKNKFLEAAATIQKYRLYLSTFPGGYDTLTVDDVLPGTATGYNQSRNNLTPGVVYYTNVIAYSYAGAHTTVSSDGFMVDHVDPTSGIVYDGKGRNDHEYTNSSDSVEAHWHGFVDTESGIKSYLWCAGLTTHVHTSYDKTECGVMPWTNVGLHVSASRNLSQQIVQGQKMYNKVCAVDGVGKFSDVVVSDGILVDKTPPVPDKLVHVSENIAMNPSFEKTAGYEVNWDNIGFTDICMVANTYHPLSWIPTFRTCMVVVTSDVNLAKDGRSFLLIQGSVHQQLDSVVVGHLYRVTFFSSHLPNIDSVAANKEGFVQLDNDRHVFLIYTKSYRRDGHGEIESREKISWHAHTFYFKPTHSHANISIGSMDVTTGIFIDHLSVQEVNLTTGHTSGHVLGHVVYLHEWSSIHGSWSFTDPESPIVNYAWSVGYVEGGTQIQPFKTAGLMNFGYNHNVTLLHNTFIYITVVATNAAGLKARSFSDRLLVDLTPPNIKYVYDGEGTDEYAWTFNEVVVNWAVIDPESGIVSCYWAIGYKPEGNDLMQYTMVTTSKGKREFPYNVLQGHTIYSTIKCENNAGLTSVKSSNGVKISNEKPSIQNANVELVSLSASEYNTRDTYQGVTNNMRLKWSGFADQIGVETFMVTYGDGQKAEKMFFSTAQDVLFASFNDMTLTETSHNISVHAINRLFYKSDKVISTLTVDKTVPKLDNTRSLSLSWATKRVIVSWNNIFRSTLPLFYEVSAGSFQAGVNILQWQETNATSITFGIPATVGVTRGLPVYVTVRAISVGGFSAVKVGSFQLP